MSRSVAIVFLVISMILALEAVLVAGEAFYDDAPAGNEDQSISLDYDNISYDTPTNKRSSNIYVHRRSCIRRGGACDHRPNECCFSSSCRCNLWGSNCRCQRMGLFQKWG